MPQKVSKKQQPAEGQSFADLYPYLAMEWDVVKNEALPASFTPMSGYKAHWKCSKEHIWQTSISDRARYNTKCPFCANSKVLAGYNDFATEHPELMKYWDWEKNDIRPEDFTSGSNRIAHWKCENSYPHTHSMPIKAFAQGRRCSYCSGHHLLSGFNDLETISPEIAAEWDWERNGELTPSTVMPGSRTKVHWKCKAYGHEWEALPFGRINRSGGCPVCSGRKVLSGFNDLASSRPDLAEEWDYEANELGPESVARATPDRYFWKCHCGHKWEASVNNRNNNNSGCPKCRHKVSKIEINFLKTFCQLCPEIVWLGSKRLDLAWNKRGWAEVDIYAIFNNSKVVIEYDGEYWHRNKFEMDIKKTTALLQEGYLVIRIRENPLADLKINHSHLLQIGYRTKSSLEETAKEIINFIKNGTFSDVKPISMVS